MVNLDKLKVGCVVQCTESMDGYYDLGELLVITEITDKKIYFTSSYGNIGTPHLINFRQVTDNPWWHYIQEGDEVTSLKTIVDFRKRGTTYRVASGTNQFSLYYIKANGKKQKGEWFSGFTPFNLKKIVDRAADVKLKRYSIW